MSASLGNCWCVTVQLHNQEKHPDLGFFPDLPDWRTRRISTALLLAVVSSFFLASNAEFAKNQCIFSNKWWLPWSQGKSLATSVHSLFLTYCLCDQSPSNGQFSFLKYPWTHLVAPSPSLLGKSLPLNFPFLYLKDFHHVQFEGWINRPSSSYFSEKKVQWLIQCPFFNVPYRKEALQHC